MVYQHNSFFSEISSYFDIGLGKNKLKGNFIGPSLFHLQQLRILDVFHCACVMESAIPICPLGFVAIVTTGKKLRFDFQSNSLPITVPVASAAPQI